MGFVAGCHCTGQNKPACTSTNPIAFLSRGWSFGVSAEPLEIRSKVEGSRTSASWIIFSMTPARLRRHYALAATQRAGIIAGDRALKTRRMGMKTRGKPVAGKESR